jgi:hypothetical protein
MGWLGPGFMSCWPATYQAEGEAAFEPRSRRPHSQPTAIPAATAALLIIRLRRELTRQGLDAGSHTIAWHLSEQYQLTVLEATIWRTLQRAGLIVPEPKKKPKAAYISLPASLLTFEFQPRAAFDAGSRSCAFVARLEAFSVTPVDRSNSRIWTESRGGS